MIEYSALATLKGVRMTTEQNSVVLLLHILSRYLVVHLVCPSIYIVEVHPSLAFTNIVTPLCCFYGVPSSQYPLSYPPIAFPLSFLP